MHSLLLMSKFGYKDNMENIVIATSNKYERTCYISFNDPYHIVVKMLENIKVDQEKFIIVDASGNVEVYQTVDKTTHVVPIKDLFKVYLFLRNLIKDEGIQLIILDSISALIYKYSELPLKQMLTDLLLEVGTFRCDSSLIVFNEHAKHEIVSHLEPFIGKSIVL